MGIGRFSMFGVRLVLPVDVCGEVGSKLAAMTLSRNMEGEHRVFWEPRKEELRERIEVLCSLPSRLNRVW